MKIKEFFKQKTKDGKRAALEYSGSDVVLWIEKHDLGLTVVDCISSIGKLGYRDESNHDVEKVRRKWLKNWKNFSYFVLIQTCLF